MKRWLTVIGYGTAGILVAVGLSFGAFAIAGKDISQPANSNIQAATPAPTCEVSESPEPGEDDDGKQGGHGRCAGSTPTPSPGWSESDSEGPDETDD